MLSLKINNKINTVILGRLESECLKSLLAYEELKQTFNSSITDNFNFRVQKLCHLAVYSTYAVPSSALDEPT